MDQQLGALGEVVEFYRDRGSLRTVDGRQSIPVVSEALLAELSPKANEVA
jgi:hypothetical protein